MRSNNNLESIRIHSPRSAGFASNVVILDAFRFTWSHDECVSFNSSRYSRDSRDSFGFYGVSYGWSAVSIETSIRCDSIDEIRQFETDCPTTARGQQVSSCSSHFLSFWNVFPLLMYRVMSDPCASDAADRKPTHSPVYSIKMYNII